MSEKNCPDKKELHLFLTGSVSVLDKEKIELHLAECAECRRELSAIFSESVAGQANFKTPANLLEEVKNLPVEKTKTEKDNEELSQAASSAPWYRRNFWQVAFAAGLLFCVGLFGLYSLQFEQTSRPDNVFRDGSSKINSIELFSPQSNAEITGDNIIFKWNKIEEAKNYTIVLSDEKGDIIREIKTETPSAERKISELNLLKGKYYFWQVKTRLNDGSFLESETRKILIK